jgi:diguanylate cyclase (GGDEF)-like protein
LRAVGNCLENLFRNEDVPCRFGGEEFVVVMPGADAGAGLRRAEQLRSKIEDIVLLYLEKNLPRITVSIGVAVFPDAGDNPQAVMKAADQALYRAKEKGRNRVELSGAAPMDADAPELHSVAMNRALAPSFYVPAAEQEQPALSLIDAS